MVVIITIIITCTTFWCASKLPFPAKMLDLPLELKMFESDILPKES